MRAFSVFLKALYPNFLKPELFLPYFENANDIVPKFPCVSRVTGLGDLYDSIPAASKITVGYNNINTQLSNVFHLISGALIVLQFKIAQTPQIRGQGQVGKLIGEEAESQQVRLLRNRSDDFDDLPDLARGVAQLGDSCSRGFSDFHRGSRDGCGVGGVLGDFLDARTHLFRTSGYGLEILADLLGRLGNYIRLGRRFLGVSRDLLASRAKFLTRARYMLGGGCNLGQQVVNFLDEGVQASA